MWLYVLLVQSWASTREHFDSIEPEIKAAPGHFGPLVPLNQQAKSGIFVLAGVIDPDDQVETGLLLHSGGRESMSEIQKIP